MVPMWHGIVARYHEGAVVTLIKELRTRRGVTYERGERAEIVRFDAARCKWVVRLEGRAFDGALIRVNEGAFQLTYCVLPAHVRAPAAFAHAARVVSGDAAAADAGEGGRRVRPAAADVLYGSAVVHHADGQGDRRAPERGAGI